MMQTSEDIDSLVTLRDVKSLTNLSHTTLYEKIKEGSFPAPIKVGRASRWFLKADVRTWLEAKRAERDSATQIA
jgi:prophage regulatory protein